MSSLRLHFLETLLPFFVSCRSPNLGWIKDIASEETQYLMPVSFYCLRRHPAYEFTSGHDS